MILLKVMAARIKKAAFFIKHRGLRSGRIVLFETSRSKFEKNDSSVLMALKINEKALKYQQIRMAYFF